MNLTPPIVNTLPAAGLHPGVSFDAYRAWPAVNFSRLKPIGRSPLHCKHAMENPREQTEAMLLGSALHAAVFEPGKFESAFTTIPKFDRRTKEGKALHEAAMNASAGRSVMDEDQFALVEGMAGAVRECRSALKFIDGPGHCELSVVWRDDGTGLDCKARFDRLTELAGRPVIVELKSTKDAGAKWFPRDIGNFGYDGQAASYCGGHKAVTGQQPLHVIIAVENTPPHAVAVYMLNDSSLNAGALKYRRWLERYAACVKSGQWPGYPDAVQVIDMPVWELNQTTEENWP